MRFERVEEFLAALPEISLPGGPVGVLLCETGYQAETSAADLARRGASALIVLGTPADRLALPDVPNVRIAEPVDGRTAPPLMNQLIDALSGRWLVWLWNGEFLFYPFCETRPLPEIVTFLAEERRPALFACAIDLYGEDLPGGADDPRDLDLSIDRTGYHAFVGETRRVDVFGALGWRFEEMIAPELQQLGRSALFRAERGVHMAPDMTFGVTEHAAISCPWHHNPTGVVASLRRTKRLFAHPNFPECRKRLTWQGTTRFDWSGAQLLDLGMMEPGQWF